MRLKKNLFFLVLMATVGGASADPLSGDQSDACAALLCLSSGQRPSECSGPLARYFSINHKKLQDTINARKNFLSICPITSADPQLESLKDAVANGAGRCDASSLNESNTSVVYIERCGDNSEGYGCWQEPMTVINPNLPDYCASYVQHGYTYKVNTITYVGNPMEGGHWINIAQ